MSLDHLTAKAADAIARLRSSVSHGFAVAIPVDEAEALLALVDALEAACPSTGPATDLEVPCGECRGRGCDACEGIGTIPTEAGRKAWAFISRRLVGEEEES